MKTIAVDFDDTLVPFIEPFLQWHNETTGSNHQFALFVTYRFSQSFGGESEYWWAKIDEFLEGRIQHKAGPSKGAQEVLARLKQNHKLIVVTARPESNRLYTEELLDQFFPNVFSELHMQDEFVNNHNKGEVCARLGASVLIDDNGRNILNAQEHSVKAILYGDFPWQAESIQNYKNHALDWYDVQRLLDEL